MAHHRITLVARRKPARLKNILFISYDGMTDPLGQSQVIPYLQGLSKKGFRIFLLSAEKENVFEKNRQLVNDLLSGYTIEWHPTRYRKSPAVISTLKDLRQLRKEASRIHQQYPINLVHTRPGIPALVGVWMKKKYGIPFLHDIREFYADSRVEGGIWNTANPLYRIIYNFFKKKEKEELAACDGIVCLTHAAEKITRALPEFRKDTPLAVIPCSADLDLFNSQTIGNEQLQNLRNELGITASDFIVSYLGSIGGWYMTNEMLHFCKLLSEKKPEAKFLFISPHLHDVIINEAARHGLAANKLIIKHGRRNEVPALLALSDYAIFFIKPCYSKLSSSPTKHGEIMAMGIPVITNSGVGDVKEIVEKYQSGFVLDEFTDEAYNQTIHQVLAGATFNKASIRSGAEEVYALDNAVENYAGLYHSILGKTNS